MRGDILNTRNGNKEQIVKALKDADMTFAPMGSGGWGFRFKEHGKIIQVTMTAEDCAPAPCYFAFIDNDTVFGNKAISIVAGILKHAGIRYSLETDCAMPSHILRLIKKVKETTP